MALRDVNALVALAWDTHVHHEVISAWFDARTGPWSTCPVCATLAGDNGVELLRL